MPLQRHRRRLTQGDLLSKIQELESILDSHGITFEALGNSWIRSHWEDKLVGGPQTTQTIPEATASVKTTSVEAEVPSASQEEESSHPDVLLASGEQACAAWLWSSLPEVVRFPLLIYASLLRMLKAENPANLSTQTTWRE